MEKPMHGYELHKQVVDLCGFGIVWNIKIGKLYAMLNRLEKEGFISSTISREGNRPIRNEFSITPKGRSTFTLWSVSPVKRGRDFRIFFLLKLYFALRTGAEQANKLITSQIDICNSWLAARNELNYKSQAAIDQNKFPTIVNSYRKNQIQGYLSWLEWCKKYLLDG